MSYQLSVPTKGNTLNHPGGSWKELHENTLLILKPQWMDGWMHGWMILAFQ